MTDDDAPRFPPPEEAKQRQARAIEPAPKPVVVARAEAPADEPAAGARPKLTSDEVRALLAVDAVNRPTSWGRVFRRGRIALVASVLLDLLAHLVLGSWATVASVAITVIAIVWTARPLLRRDDWT